jgi:rod shape-determining protein MreD
MKWFALGLAMIVCVVLQTTVSPRLAIGSVRPDFLLLLAVFLAMHVRGVDVIAAGCALGMVADLQSLERFGLLAIAYAAASAAVYLVRTHVFRSHPLAHLTMTLLAGLIVQLVILLYCIAFTGVGGGSWGGQVFGGVLIAVYSALWAPPLHAVLLRLAPWVGVDVPRYAQAGMV